MVHPLLSKLAMFGILTALGGAGAAATISPHAVPVTSPVGSAPMAVSADDDTEDEAAVAGEAPQGKRDEAHVARDAKREAIHTRSETRRAILRDERAQPGEAPRGLTPAQREALHEASRAAHPAHPERAERAARPERDAQAEHAPRAERAERVANPERAERAANPERGAAGRANAMSRRAMHTDH